MKWVNEEGDLVVALIVIKIKMNANLYIYI